MACCLANAASCPKAILLAIYRAVSLGSQQAFFLHPLQIAKLSHYKTL